MTETERIVQALLAKWEEREEEMRARPVRPDPRNPNYSVTSPRSSAIRRCRDDLMEAFGIA